MSAMGLMDLEAFLYSSWAAQIHNISQYRIKVLRRDTTGLALSSRWYTFLCEGVGYHVYREQNRYKLSLVWKIRHCLCRENSCKDKHTISHNSLVSLSSSVCLEHIYQTISSRRCGLNNKHIEDKVVNYLNAQCYGAQYQKG